MGKTLDDSLSANYVVEHVSAKSDCNDSERSPSFKHLYNWATRSHSNFSWLLCGGRSTHLRGPPTQRSPERGGVGPSAPLLLQPERDGLAARTTDPAQDTGVLVSKMEETVEANYQASLKTAKDPDGGPAPAYPRGKLLDEASGKTGSGKKFYHNVLSGDEFVAQPCSVAVITPVIHCCMGGLEIDDDSLVVGTDSQPTRGLHAAGEVAGKTISGKKVHHNVISVPILLCRFTRTFAW